MACAIKTNLLEHQSAAVEKLLPTRVGALFMEMGTGKTRTAIELILRRADRGRVGTVVWFCPVSLRETIRHEIIKHTTATDVHVFDDKTTEVNLPDCFWHVVGIESMSASERLKLAAAALIRHDTYAIVDESTYIKGHHSARTCWITRICERCRYRLILTGTPLTQGVVDLFAQMRFLSPEILGYRSFYSFARNHLEYSDKFPGMIVRAHNVEWLAAKMQPYVYQVTKAECLTLPEKMHETRWFIMTGTQRSLYEQAKEHILLGLEDWDDFNSHTIFRLFTALQQIACGYWREQVRGESGGVRLHEVDHVRLAELTDVVDHIPAADKVIIWAKDRYSIAAIVRHLGAEQCAEFHGGIGQRQREEQLSDFRNGKRFFVATPSCAGHGLTLNEAAYVVFYNDGFKYSERLQAEDRCHRIGQFRAVTYITIACSGSIDERIRESLEKKGDTLKSFKAEIDKIRDKRGKVSKEQLKKIMEKL